MAPTATAERIRPTASVRRTVRTERPARAFETVRQDVREAAAHRSHLRLLRAEQTECTCPDFCERDHDNE